MRKCDFILFMLIIPVAMIFSQNQATWEPSEPDFGETLTITFDPSLSADIVADAEIVKLHWGINELKQGAWLSPPEEIWPENSNLHTDNVAVQSPMIKGEDGKWTVAIVTVDTIRSIHFVFTDGTKWDNNNSSNWNVYFGGLGPPPKEHNHTVTLEITVDMSQAIRSRGFSYGDTLEFRCGYFDTADKIYTIPLERNFLTPYYVGTDTIRTTLQDTLDYSFYAIKNGVPNWEVYFNFDYHDPTNSEAQRRRLRLRKWTQVIVDTVKNQTDSHRAPFFRNMNVLAQDVLVTLECDARPAYYHLSLGGDSLRDVQPSGSGGVHITDPEEILTLGMAVNGPITGSWSNDASADWGPHLMDLDNKCMYDDGTHGDKTAGDTIFTKQFQFYKDSADVVGQEFKFGIGGGDNESGFGNNHVANIDDFESAYTIEAQFGSIYPTFYSEWDYNNRKMITSVAFEHGSPYTHVLSQNYPNPFNPSTTMKFTLPKSENVTLRIFNTRGEMIATLIDHRMPAGSHTATWQGVSDQGRQVSTGMYLCRFQAGDFTKTMKMMMMK